MNEFLNFVTYFSESIFEMNPVLFGQVLRRDDRCRDRIQKTTPQCARSAEPKWSTLRSRRIRSPATCNAILLSVTRANVRALTCCQVRLRRDAQGRCRTEGILSGRSTNTERTQTRPAHTRTSAWGHQVWPGRARALMYRGGPDRHRRWSSCSKHLWAATGLSADN